MFYIFYFLFYLPLRILFPTRVIGRKNICKGKTIIICNHRTLMDPILLLILIPRRLSLMGKKELFDSAFKNWFLRIMGAYPIDRSGADITAIKNTLYLLKKGKAVVIFPEGTRNKGGEDEDMLKLKNGVSMLSIKSGSPIIPMYFEKKIKLFRMNKLYIGESFELSKFKGEKLTQNVLDDASVIIRDKMEKLRSKVTSNRRKDDGENVIRHDR